MKINNIHTKRIEPLYLLMLIGQQDAKKKKRKAITVRRMKKQNALKRFSRRKRYDDSNENNQNEFIFKFGSIEWLIYFFSLLFLVSFFSIKIDRETCFFLLLFSLNFQTTIFSATISCRYFNGFVKLYIFFFAAAPVAAAAAALYSLFIFLRNEGKHFSIFYKHTHTHK